MERTGKGFEGMRKGFQGKGKGHTQIEGDFHGGPIHHQKQHRHDGKNTISMQQEQGIPTASDHFFHDFSSIFSSTPIVQPAGDHDHKFRQIFSSTLVVQPISSFLNSFPFQKCPFRDINSKWLPNTTDKSIFKGKAIVQPTKPFFLNPHFHDQRMQQGSKGSQQVNFDISPHFEKGESSHHI